VQVFHHRLGDAHTIVRGGSTTDLVEDHQAAPSRLTEDRGSFCHLHHERGEPAAQVVVRADAGEDAIAYPDRSLLCRDVRTDLSEQHDARDLTQIGGLAGHVRSGQDDDARALVEAHIVGDESPWAERALHERMASTPDAQGR
jgi:hypothetical protein